jgi:hypothetical protein
MIKYLPIYKIKIKKKQQNAYKIPTKIEGSYENLKFFEEG